MVADCSDSRLLQYHLAHVVETFVATSVRDEQSGIWRIVVPDIAFTARKARRDVRMLVTRGMHCHTSDSHDSCSRYLEIAEAHGDVFVKESRQQLQGSDTSDPEPVWHARDCYVYLDSLFYMCIDAMASLLQMVHHGPAFSCFEA